MPIKVELLTHTNYKGHALKIGDNFVVDAETANRWNGRGIAKIVDIGDSKVTENDKSDVDEATLNETEVDEPVEHDSSKYEGMKPKALYDLCVSRKLDVEAKKDEAYYIEKLVEADNAK